MGPARQPLDIDRQSAGAGAGQDWHRPPRWLMIAGQECRRRSAATMTESDAVLATNLEFYRAFATQDFAAMERLWSRKAMVLCTHPGWLPLTGREAVMESWRNILGNPEAPNVMCHDDIAFLYGAMAVVLCEEELSSGHLAATNVFIKEDGSWRLVHHQASPILTRDLPLRARRH
jgi:ketosteroid isomerase-like protein